MQNKEKLKNILLIIFFVGLFTYFTVSSGMNIVTFIFGENKELSPDRVYVSAADDSSWWNYTITYNNGEKLVHDNIRLSMIESMQLRKNGGSMNFRYLNGHVTHRSAFIWSLVLFIILAWAIGLFVSGFFMKKKESV